RSGPRLAPPRMEALSNAVLDILSQSAYKREQFPDFGAFAAWLHRWTRNMALRAKHREIDVHEPGALKPFKTRTAGRLKFVGTINRCDEGIVERTEEEVSRFCKGSRFERPLSDESSKCLKDWMRRDVREEFKASMRRHHQNGEPGAA